MSRAAVLPQVMEDARGAAVAVAERGGVTPQMAAALAAYGFWKSDGKTGA